MSNKDKAQTRLEDAVFWALENGFDPDGVQSEVAYILEGVEDNDDE